MAKSRKNTAAAAPKPVELVSIIDPPGSAPETPQAEDSPRYGDARREAADRVRRALSPYGFSFQRDVLVGVLTDTQQVLEPAGTLNAMEAEIRGIAKRMAPKDRAIMGILLELAALEGRAVEVNFGQDIVYGDLTDPDTIEKAMQEFPDDADLQTMGKVYKLTQTLEEADDARGRAFEAERQALAEQAEPPGEQAEAQGKPTTPRLSLEKASLEFQPIVKYLLGLTPTSRLAVVLVSELLSHEDDIRHNGQYDGTVGNDALLDWSEELSRTMGDSDVFDDPQDAATAGFMAALRAS